MICKAGCSFQEIVSAANINQEDLRGEKLNQSLPRTRDVVAEYKYHNESGKVLYVKRRHEPKTFTVGSYQGGVWFNGLPSGVDPVPYNLHWLCQHADAPVAILEGEKDCDNFARQKFGILPVCSHGGSSNWPVEYGIYFHDREVVVIPDNDSAGINYAQKVIGSLVMSGVKSVSLASMQGLPEKYDVTDILEDQGPEELYSRIHAAIPYGKLTD